MLLDLPGGYDRARLVPVRSRRSSLGRPNVYDVASAHLYVPFGRCRICESELSEQTVRKIITSGATSF